MSITYVTYGSQSLWNGPSSKDKDPTQFLLLPNSTSTELHVQPVGSTATYDLTGSFGYNALRVSANDVVGLFTTFVGRTNGVVSESLVSTVGLDVIRMLFTDYNYELAAYAGNDTFVGSSTQAVDDYIRGGSGNDTFTGFGSSTNRDNFHGGSGRDTAVYRGAYSEYTVTKSSTIWDVFKNDGSLMSGYVVADKTASRDGTDNLSDVELFQFSDRTVSIAQVDAAQDVKAVFRFFNAGTGTHFYTASAVEADSVIRNLDGFNYEGVAFDKNAAGAGATLDIFRFYNTSTGTHFYTGSVAEKNAVLASLPSFNYEGVAYQGHLTQDAGTTALYRFFNTQTGTLYTASAIEMQNVKTTLAGIYNYEGVAYYVDVA